VGRRCPSESGYFTGQRPGGKRCVKVLVGLSARGGRVFPARPGFRGKFPLNGVVTCVTDRVQIIPIKHWFLDLDRLLRGDATRTATLRERGVDFSSGGLIGAVLILGVFYGVCMGSYAVVSGRGGRLAADVGGDVQGAVAVPADVGRHLPVALGVQRPRGKPVTGGQADQAHRRGDVG